jgi:F-type H+-transporting ATPase subunit gamma
MLTKAVQSSLAQQGMLTGMPVRTFASLRQVKSRMKTVKSLQKITKAVGMMASARIRKAELRKNASKVFASSLNTLFPEPDENELKEREKDRKGKKILLTVVASDRGLCGSFSSSIVRQTKKELDGFLRVTDKVSLVSFGEKARAGLFKGFGDNYEYAVTDMVKLKQPNFLNLSLAVEPMGRIDFDDGLLIYNSWKNMAAYQQKKIPLRSKTWYLKEGKKALQSYEIYAPKTSGFLNLVEFRQAVNMWDVMIDSDATELVARMAAMNGASKNTKEILRTLQLHYNKTRQGAITRELCEIVSGMTGLEG